MIRKLFRLFGKRKCRSSSDRRGAASVEFALIFPAFLFVIFVCCEVARINMLRNLAQNAAYEAARFAMTDGSKIQDGIDRANSILGRLGPHVSTVLINGSDGSENEDGEVENEIDFQTGEVTCEIELFLKDNTLVFPGFLCGDAKIQASMTVRTERYRGYYDGSSVD